MEGETVVVEGDVVEGEISDDASLAYEQGLAVGGLAVEAAQTAELAEETAAQVDNLETQERYQWEAISNQLQSLESRLVGIEGRMIEQQIETEAVLEELEEPANQEAEPALEVEVPEPAAETETPEESPSIFGTPRKRKRVYRLP